MERPVCGAAASEGSGSGSGGSGSGGSDDSHRCGCSSDSDCFELEATLPDNLTAICEGGVCVEGCRWVDHHDADCVVLIGLKVFRGTKIAGYCSSVEGGNFLRFNKTTCFRADTACLGFDEMCSNSSVNMCAFCEGSQCAEGCAADANCLGIGVLCI